MLAQADFQRALSLALGEFAPGWTLVGDCAAVDPSDASHWGSGPQSFQATLRHRVTGHVKVLGRRAAYEPGATVHPAVALSLIGAYRHGNSEPIRAYLEEIGVAAGGGDKNPFFRRPAAQPSARAVGEEPAQIRAAGLAVVAPLSSHDATQGATAVVDGIDSLEPEVDDQPPRTGPRSWGLLPRWPSFRTGHARAPREVARPAPPPLPRSARMPQVPEAQRPMLGRLRRELQIWYWRRGAGHALDKK